MTRVDKVLKSKDSTLLTKVHVVNAMVFPVITFSCESWTINKAEHWRIDAFELWCWRRLLRVPWTARRPIQSIWKEINPEFSLEGLMLKLKLHYFDNLMRTGHSLGEKKKTWCRERLKAEGEEGNRGWDSWMASLMKLTWTWTNFGRWWGTGRPGVL